MLVIKAGVASVLATDLRVGFPAGIALAAGDGTLFVSGLDPETLTDLVLAIDVKTKAVARYTGSAENNIGHVQRTRGSAPRQESQRVRLGRQQGQRRRHCLHSDHRVGPQHARQTEAAFS